jgi:hypothetical protein
MYGHDENGYAEIPCDTEVDNPNAIDRKIMNVRQSIAAMTRESEKMKFSHQKLADDAGSLKRIYSMAFETNEASGMDNEAFEMLSKFLVERNRALESELSSLTNDLKLGQILKSQYEDALFMAKVRSEIARMRIAIHIRHPAGEIHLSSHMRHVWSKVPIDDPRVSKPKDFKSPPVSPYEQVPYKPTNRVSKKTKPTSPKRMYSFSSSLLYCIYAPHTSLRTYVHIS